MSSKNVINKFLPLHPPLAISPVDITSKVHFYFEFRKRGLLDGVVDIVFKFKYISFKINVLQAVFGTL